MSADIIQNATEVSSNDIQTSKESLEIGSVLVSNSQNSMQVVELAITAFLESIKLSEQKMVQLLVEFKEFFHEHFSKTPLTQSQTLFFMQKFTEVKNNLRIQEVQKMEENFKNTEAIENLKLLKDGRAEFSLNGQRTLSSLSQVIDIVDRNPSKTSTPSTRKSSFNLTPLLKKRGSKSKMPFEDFESLENAVQALDKPNSQGKYRSAFYRRKNKYLITQKSNKKDTDAMHEIGASFDWAFLMWYVPEDTMLSDEYKKYMLSEEENKIVCDLHEQLM